MVGNLIDARNIESEKYEGSKILFITFSFYTRVIYFRLMNKLLITWQKRGIAHKGGVRRSFFREVGDVITHKWLERRFISYAREARQKPKRKGRRTLCVPTLTWTNNLQITWSCLVWTCGRWSSFVYSWWPSPASLDGYLKHASTMNNSHHHFYKDGSKVRYVKCIGNIEFQERFVRWYTGYIKIVRQLHFKESSIFNW